MAVALYSTGYRPCHTGSSGHRPKILHRDRSQKLASRKHQKRSPRQDGRFAASKDERHDRFRPQRVLHEKLTGICPALRSGIAPRRPVCWLGKIWPGRERESLCAGRANWEKGEEGKKRKPSEACFVQLPRARLMLRNEWSLPLCFDRASQVPTCWPVSARALISF